MWLEPRIICTYPSGPSRWGVTENINETAGMDDRKTLTIIRTYLAPFGLNVGPPVFRLDKCLSRLEWECEIAAVTV
jgi:hypothetical protein